jgi:NTE family protein
MMLFTSESTMIIHKNREKMLKKFAAASTIPEKTTASTWDDDHVPIKVALVLTGGGSHGAFEAGVLEALAEEIEFTSISGTSAGGVNAVLFGSGLNASGPQEAIRRLREGWNVIKLNGNIFGRTIRCISDQFLSKDQQWPNSPSLIFNPMGMLQPYMPSYVARFVSKTVKDIVGDWGAEVQNGRVKIHINTALEIPNEPGKFEHVHLAGKDLTPDGVGASANLKPLGVHYINDTTNPAHTHRLAYDGAYKENGPLSPHLEQGITDCIMIILHDRRHNQLDKKGELKHAEIHSNALDLASQDSIHPIHLHAIEIESLGGEIGGLSHMNDSSKLNTDPEFIDLLYQAGLKAGRKWLKENKDNIGQISSYNFYPPALEQLAEMNYA